MKKLSLSLLSAAVSAGIMSAGVMAAPQTGPVQPQQKQSFKQSVLQQVETVTGLQSHFDRNTGQITFQWAPKRQITPNFTGVAQADRPAFAANFYLSQLTGYSTEKSDRVAAVQSNFHDTGRGGMVAKYHQEIDGIEVFNREFNLVMDREFNLVASSGYLASRSQISQLAGPAQTWFGEAEQAIAQAFSKAGGNATKLALSHNKQQGKYNYFVASAQSEKQIVGAPRAKKVYFDVHGKLTPGWYVELQVAEPNSVESDYLSYVVDAVNGKILFENNLTAHAEAFNYRIYANEDASPWDSPHGNVVPATSADQVDVTDYLEAPLRSFVSGPISTEDPWLADDATITSGNNAFAYVDAIAPDGFSNGDVTAETTSAMTFDYPYDTTQTENSLHNRKAAVVNLFYMNNYLHDDFYDHGFDEASGNAQENNFDRGGEEGDPLHVQVQDFSGTNNANMSTPADGASPRMQMYLWDSKDAVNGEDYGITASGDLGLLASTKRSAFGPGQFEISGKLVRIEDATPEINDGCEAAVNGAALAGNIAIIDRGACAFTQKVLNAQAAGAVAVIIANNRDGDIPAPMGGSDSSVTIPNMGISQNDGAAIYTAMAAGDVSVEMFNTKPYKGSSWDNAIVAHEWGHYISNRLVGNSSGLINNQGRSMGEGWGDFHALLAITDASDLEIEGNDQLQKAYAAISYVASFYYGIRRYPYSTDMTINPHTFKSIEDNAEVHASGEIWATMLWDSFVALVNEGRYDYDEAKSRMKDYLVAGYKLTPIAPTYTEARDAILAAAYANDEADYAAILGAFARRGMGAGAESPDRNSTDHLGVVESYETSGFSSMAVDTISVDTNYEGVSSGYCTNDGILDKGETGTFSFTIKNNGTEALDGFTAQLSVDGTQTVTFANDGQIEVPALGLFESATTAPLEFSLDDAATADVLSLKLTFPEFDPAINGTNEQSVDLLVNLDFAPRDPEGMSSTSDMETYAREGDWHEIVQVGGERAVGTVGLDNGNNVGFFSSFGFDLGSTILFINNNGFESDVSAESNVVEVGYGGDFVVSFWHFYGLEQDWDGGVVEISVNGGDWVDVTEMGGKFAVGYNTDALIENPNQVLQNRPVFSGIHNAGGIWGGMESINFGTALNGNRVKLRFRVGSDYTAKQWGWWIDNVTFSNIVSPVFTDVVAGDSVACDNRLPVISEAADVEAKERDAAGAALNTIDLSVSAYDPNGDELSYQWTQLSGPEVALSGADTANASFTSPQLDTSVTLEFEVTVSDGKDEVSKIVKVSILDVADEAPAVESNDDGGGSLGLFGLLMLPLVWLRRRTTRA